MEILEEGALQKALNAEKKTRDENPPRKTIYEVIEDDYFDELQLKSQREFPKKCKVEYTVPQFIPHEFINKIQQVRIEYGFFSQMVRIKTEVVVVYKSSKAKPPKTILNKNTSY